MDFFLVNGSFYFVDFPGYSYAMASSNIREKLRKMILWYLLYSEVKHRLVILVLDSKVGITEFDNQTIEMLKEKKIAFLIVANKVDKLKQALKDKQLNIIIKSSLDSKIIPYSTLTGLGHDDLIKEISIALANFG
jgi:GTP-binding protein